MQQQGGHKLIGHVNQEGDNILEGSQGIHVALSCGIIQLRKKRTPVHLVKTLDHTKQVGNSLVV